MSFEASQQTERVTHATLVFEREIPATVEKVFAAFASAKLRSEWGAPSETATIIYDQEDFREGGEDRFRCGSKSDPNIHGTTRYLEIAVQSTRWRPAMPRDSGHASAGSSRRQWRIKLSEATRASSL